MPSLSLVTFTSLFLMHPPTPPLSSMCCTPAISPQSFTCFYYITYFKVNKCLSVCTPRSNSNNENPSCAHHPSFPSLSALSVFRPPSSARFFHPRFKFFLFSLRFLQLPSSSSSALGALFWGVWHFYLIKQIFNFLGVVRRLLKDKIMVRSIVTCLAASGW